jgi:hypothetical protein
MAPQPLTLSQAIAASMKRLREERDPRWRQEDLAQAMRRLGFPWTRVTVAEVERGAPDSKTDAPGRQVSVEELFGLTSAFGVSVDMFLWHDDGILLQTPMPELADEGVLPRVLFTQWKLWIALMSFSSIEKITSAQAATLMEAERQRVVSTMTERIDSLVNELHSTADWFREESRSRLIEPIEPKGKKQ